MAKISAAQLKAVVKYIAVLWPIVKELVKTAEEAGGAGSTKLAAVRAGMEKIWDNAVAFATVWDDKLKPAVESLVALWSVLGVFKKKG